jgi:hypothetical protein
MLKTKAPEIGFFRGWITQLLHWLSTLRRDCYRPTTQDSLRLPARLYRTGFEPAGSNRRFQSHIMSLFLLLQATLTLVSYVAQQHQNSRFGLVWGIENAPIR